MGWIAAVTFFSALIVSTLANAAASRGIESRAAAAMFSEYETVFSTKTDLSSHFSSFKGLSRPAAKELTIPFGDLIDGFAFLDPYVAAALLPRSEAVLMGGSGFVRPNIGLSKVSRFSYIVTFGKQGRPDFQKYTAKAHRSSVAGDAIWSWRDLREPAVTYFAAQIGDSYLLVSNDLRDLQTIARKLTSADQASDPPSGIRDWQELSQSGYWGYRRANGPTVKEAASLDDDFPSAEALVFFCDLTEKTSVLRLFSAKRNDGERKEATVRRLFREKGSDSDAPAMSHNLKMCWRPLEFEAQGAGVWDASVPLVGDNAYGQTSCLMLMFGFESPF